MSGPITRQQGQACIARYWHRWQQYFAPGHWLLAPACNDDDRQPPRGAA